MLARYARGVDREDYDLIASCYHPGAVDAHGGSYSGSATGFVDWVREHPMEQGSLRMHLLGQPKIDVERDTAFVETYALAFSRHPGACGFVWSSTQDGQYRILSKPHSLRVHDRMLRVQPHRSWDLSVRIVVGPLRTSVHDHHRHRCLLQPA